MKNIRIYNHQIHEEASVSASEFLERVKFVEEIRVEEISFSIYPRSDNELKRIEQLWEFVNGNLNGLNSETGKFFMAEIPEWLYTFLRFTPRDKIYQPFILALAGFYAIDRGERAWMEDFLHPDLFSKVKDLYEEHFSDFENLVFIQSDDLLLMDEFNRDYFQKENEFKSRFDYLYRDTVGNPLILPYIYPIRDNRFEVKSKLISKKQEVGFTVCYFKDTDWERIIEVGIKDTLKKAESNKQYWDQWKTNFINFHDITENQPL